MFCAREMGKIRFICSREAESNAILTIVSIWE